MTAGLRVTRDEPPLLDAALPLTIRPAGHAIVAVPAGGRLVVGSADVADLTLPGMRPQHAVFYPGGLDDRVWCLAPFTNDHSWANGEPMFGPRKLRRGDRLKLGTAEFTVET